MKRRVAPLQRPSRVGQDLAIGTATERTATTRLKGLTFGLSLSRVGQHAAIGTATERSATTRPTRAHLQVVQPQLVDGVPEEGELRAVAGAAFLRRVVERRLA